MLLRVQGFINRLVTIDWLRRLTNLEFKHGNLEINNIKLLPRNLPEFDGIFRVFLLWSVFYVKGILEKHGTMSPTTFVVILHV